MQFQPWGIEVVLAMFPEPAAKKNVVRYFQTVENALNEQGIGTGGVGDKGNTTGLKLKIYAYAAIRAETASFQPIPERVCRLNTLRTADVSAISNNNLSDIAKVANRIIKDHSWDDQFGLYNNRLGNDIRGEAEKYKGRGFIQLTGKENYIKMSKRLPLPELVDNPDLALDPVIAARIAAAYVAANADGIVGALAAGDYKKARKAVNGGTNGMDHFLPAYMTGTRLALPNDAPDVSKIA